MGVGMMKKKGRTLAVSLFAAVWWGIFYPELCFSEETCEVVTSEEMRENALSAQMKTTGGRDVPGAEADAFAAAGRIEAEEVWDASGDEIVISSRFLEWLEENLAAGKD